MEKRQHKSLRHGGYLAASTAAVLAIVVIVNLIVGQLPSHLREIDLSDNKLYTVSDTSKELLAGLDREVEVVVLAEESGMDERISRFLDSYAALSGYIKLSYVDPVAHPSAAESYGASADSIVVECADTGKSRTVSFDEILVYDQMYYYMYGQTYYTEFDAEGQLSSAVDYVTGDTDKMVYTMENHGEAAFSDAVTGAIQKANLTLGSVSLSLSGGVPEDCALLISCGAAKDLTDDELAMVKEYLEVGGQVMFLLAQTEEKLPNWESLMADYGLRLVDGYIADTQRYYQQLGSAFAIAPALSSSSEVTQGFQSDDLTLMYNARGMEALETVPDGVTVTPFLTTSSGGVAVTADNAQTEGTYTLGAVSTKTTDSGTARFTVFSSASFIDESILNTMSNGVNLDVFMNALTAGFDDVTNVSIPAKSLETTYNTIANAGLWSLIFVAFLPIATLAVGLVCWVRRRKL